ncbi:MAG: hypothetical protein ACYC6Y_00450 [Thermoguttaceae bacterium]
MTAVMRPVIVDRKVVPRTLVARPVVVGPTRTTSVPRIARLAAESRIVTR